MARLGAVTRFFERFAHPWLAALAAAGAVWLLLSFPVGYLGPRVHPLFTTFSLILHVLGVATVLLSGIVFGILWWTTYLNGKFFSEK